MVPGTDVPLTNGAVHDIAGESSAWALRPRSNREKYYALGPIKAKTLAALWWPRKALLRVAIPLCRPAKESPPFRILAVPIRRYPRGASSPLAIPRLDTFAFEAYLYGGALFLLPALLRSIGQISRTLDTFFRILVHGGEIARAAK
jgi:hypothetical protein